MSRRTAIPVALAALAVLTPTPGAASAAERFRGVTEQDRRVTVRVGDDGQVTLVLVRWRADCREPGLSLTEGTRIPGPFPRATPDRFRRSGRYRTSDGARIRIAIRFTLTGRRTFDPAEPAAESWPGILRARAVVRRRGRVIDRCRLRTTGWTASLASPAP